MTMTFKEALIAHLQGEKVEYKIGEQQWRSFALGMPDVMLKDAIKDGYGAKSSYRLAPRTILVNGVEVPAPEKDAPKAGCDYHIPMPSKDSRYTSAFWDGCEFDVNLLAEGLVYLDKESAIARAKAMLITQEVK